VALQIHLQKGFSNSFENKHINNTEKAKKK